MFWNALSRLSIDTVAGTLNEGNLSPMVSMECSLEGWQGKLDEPRKRASLGLDEATIEDFLAMHKLIATIKAIDCGYHWPHTRRRGTT
jgi:hypothetical protein